MTDRIENYWREGGVVVVEAKERLKKSICPSVPSHVYGNPAFRDRGREVYLTNSNSTCSSIFLGRV